MATGKTPAAGPPELIKGLLAELPARGEPFPADKRERWLKALAVNLDLIYGEAGTDDDR